MNTVVFMLNDDIHATDADETILGGACNKRQDPESQIALPVAPKGLATRAVRAWSESVTIDSYLPEEPDPLPSFFETRVYQGSSGRVYPLPFHERIAKDKAPHLWQAIHLENEFIRVMIMPELGGRIHIAYDKTADYDFFYRNNVIKPALVGLAGPWISGGVEFNWPQHHRPATMLPVDYSIEEELDGSVTVWCSDHDPFARMKGMHGIRLRPGSSVLEARVRLFNRTDRTQTFLWWANVAAAVNDDYQAFFPTDVSHVADHAKRSITGFPRADEPYYGIDYRERAVENPGSDGIDWYKNIPVPTSYMVLSTDDDFFGGYDHGRGAGFVHWADKRIAPGKKMWTWGDSPFGRAWDRNLTDADGPYIELMAGVYTDNQPDFTFLKPGETKSFSQYWYPITGIGVVHQANRDVAVHFEVDTDAAETHLNVGVAATQVYGSARIIIAADGDTLFESDPRQLAPGNPIIVQFVSSRRYQDHELTVRVVEGERELISWTPRHETEVDAPSPAVAPPTSTEVSTSDELYYIASYLEQYRHPTRRSEPYWREALRLDAGDVRSNVGLALNLVSRGEFAEAEQHLRRAVSRQREWVSNPIDGEALYSLGLVELYQGKLEAAAQTFAKAAWNGAWTAAAQYQIARIACRAGDYTEAESALQTALRSESEHAQAANLLVTVLRSIGRGAEATAILADTLSRDPLDQWARDLAGEILTADAPTILDVALEYAGAGFGDEALRLLELAAENAENSALGQVRVGPIASYHAARIHAAAGRLDEARSAIRMARVLDIRSCFASRIDDYLTLLWVSEAFPSEGRALALLGHWYYDKDRHLPAIECWKSALTGEIDSTSAMIVHRNLGLAQFNVLNDRTAAREHYAAARELAPQSAKLLYEENELRRITGESAQARLVVLESEPLLLAERDDLAIATADALIDVGRLEDARAILQNRVFQPWEGGEGRVLESWERVNSEFAAIAYESANHHAAVEFIRAAFNPPLNLNEARHELVNSAKLHLRLGDVLHLTEQHRQAREHWQTAAAMVGDFQAMSDRPFSDQSVYSIIALRRLGELEIAAQRVSEFSDYVQEFALENPSIDYFATSLPNMLLFRDDLAERKAIELGVLRQHLAWLDGADDDLELAVWGSAAFNHTSSADKENQ